MGLEEQQSDIFYRLQMTCNMGKNWIVRHAGVAPHIAEFSVLRRSAFTASQSCCQGRDQIIPPPLPPLQARVLRDQLLAQAASIRISLHRVTSGQKIALKIP